MSCQPDCADQGITTNKFDMKVLDFVVCVSARWKHDVPSTKV
jgi:hypothetical protein